MVSFCFGEFRVEGVSQLEFVRDEGYDRLSFSVSDDSDQKDVCLLEKMFDDDVKLYPVKVVAGSDLFLCLSVYPVSRTTLLNCTTYTFRAS